MATAKRPAVARDKSRSAKVMRKTAETDITLELSLDGTGKSAISTGIPFFDHMLTLTARHGLLDLKLKAAGDTEVDFHHTVEDVGLALGEAVKTALGDKSGIRRYGSSDVPMMDSLSTVILDISGRPYLKFNVSDEAKSAAHKVFTGHMKKANFNEAFDMGFTEEFMKAFSNAAGVDLHVFLHYGTDVHHSIEAIFKALGRALSVAVGKDARIKGVMSTKGKL